MKKNQSLAGPAKKRFLQDNLLEWYASNQRDFPWRRGEASNYQIIISEIFLQRTQAATVKTFYHVFFSRYPGWDSLCQASMHDIEELMKPLGLYKQRSKRIFGIAAGLKERGFEWPNTREEAHEAGMSGLYISNAYELFVLKRRAALLDVNMARVLSRYFEYENAADIRIDRFLHELSAEMVNVWQCKQINWAFLDFAAMVCKARNPLCKNCPLRAYCSHFNYCINNYVEVFDNKKVTIKMISSKKRKSE